MHHEALETTLMGETAMAAAFKAAGVDPNEAKFQLDLARYLNNGGTGQRAIEIIHELLGEDLSRDVFRGPLRHVDTKQANGSAGDRAKIATHHEHVSPLPPQARASGQFDRGDIALQSPAGIPRAPSAAQIKAQHSVAKKIALSAFERELTHTGRQWGNVCYRELDNFREDGDVANGLKAHIGLLRGDERHKTIKELMTPREFLGVLRKVRGRHDH